jgi:hypothetical protein
MDGWARMVRICLVSGVKDETPEKPLEVLSGEGFNPTSFLSFTA